MDTIELSRAITMQVHRIEAIAEGLSDEQLTKVVLPSGWSIAGMVCHVREGVRFWCRQIMLGDPAPTGEPDEGDVFVVPSEQVRPVVETFVSGCLADLDAVSDVAADAPPAWWPEGLWGAWRLDNFGQVLAHLLVEVSTHSGHLDAARELLDGGVFDYEIGAVRPA